MTTLPEVIINAGIIPEGMVRELRRWGCEVPDANPTAIIPDAESLLLQIDQAVQDAGYVLTRETDLDAVREFARNARRGTLYLSVELDGDHFEQIPDTSYAETSTGTILFPWPTDDMAHLLTRGDSHLVTSEAHGAREKIYMEESHELFFGTDRAFLVMRVAYKEPFDGTK